MACAEGTGVKSEFSNPTINHLQGIPYNRSVYKQRKKPN